MKKRIGLGVLLCLTCILLCACGKQLPAEQDPVAGATADSGSAVPSDNSSGQVPQDDGEAQPAAKPERKAEDLVGKQFSFSGTRGSEEYGYTMDVNYIVPKILSDGSAAQAINDDIRTFCLDVIEPTEDELDFPTWYNVGYEAYLNGDILSIVITKLCSMDDASAYATFNYNVKDESVVNNAALLKSCGYTEETFAAQMRKAVAYESDDNMQFLFEAEYWDSDDTERTERQLMYAEHMRYRQNSIASDRVNVQMPMYLDEAGDLKVFAEIDVPAGVGSYTAVLTPRAESKAKDFELRFENTLFLTYKDGVMKIRIEKGDWSEAAFGGAGSLLEFGREYTVESIYKDYIDGEMQFVFDGEYAVPVFVSDDGMVSALNIYACAPAGYFCLTEPVMGLSGVEAVTETNGDRIASEVGETLIGQCPGFAKRALGIYGQEGVEKTYGAWNGEAETDAYSCYIGFDDWDEGRLLYQVGVSGDGNDDRCYSGECRLIGMNEDGMILASCVYAAFTDPYDPDPHYSAFSLKKHSKWDDLTDDLEEWADFKKLSGFITFDGADDLVKLEVTYG